METDVSTSSSVRTVADGPVGRLAFWVLVDGNRFAVSTGISAAVTLVFAALIVGGILDVGPNSGVATVFGSGLTSGVATLLTIALSINQLILSRVFGSPAGLSDRLQGSRDLRRRVQDIADEPTSPNDPAAFLSLIARTLRDRAAALETALDESTWDPPDEVDASVQDLIDYGANVDDQLEEHANIIQVLDAILGTEYAENMAAVERIRNVHADSLPASAQTELEAIDDLLESIAVTRQFLKTLSLQQDFGQLARVLVFSGFVAFVVVISLTLLYQRGSVTVPPAVLPPVISVGIGVILFPFAAFSAYILRAAVIARRTVSVGPFIPPQEQ